MKINQKIIELLPKLQNTPVLIVGDLMLDEYLVGDAERISPEAPIPVVLVEKQKSMLGGAGNVARNVKSLGGDISIVSVCGDGANSQKLKSAIDAEEIDHRLVTLAGRPASTKTRVLARQQQMLRIDHEDASPISKQETEEVLQEVYKLWPTKKTLIISDYNKGLLSKQLMDGLMGMKKDLAKTAKENEFKILVDPKPQNFLLYKNVDLLTPNALETGACVNMPTKTQEDIVKAGRAIFEQLNCRHLLTTLGPLGMALFNTQKEITHIPTTARKVFDVTGAGDTVIATLALCLAAGIDLLDACIIANYAAGIVVGEVGSVTTTPNEIKEFILHHEALGVKCWV